MQRGWLWLRSHSILHLGILPIVSNYHQLSGFEMCDFDSHSSESTAVDPCLRTVLYNAVYFHVFSAGIENENGTSWHILTCLDEANLSSYTICIYLPSINLGCESVGLLIWFSLRSVVWTALTVFAGSYFDWSEGGFRRIGWSGGLQNTFTNSL